MIQHQILANKDMKTPEFNFRVVKSYKTSLERQIGEAIRIQSRGNVLNQRGEYNRCNITRLVLDSKWEEESWKKSWESTEEESPEDEISLVKSSKSKSKGRGSVTIRRGEKLRMRRGV